MLVQDAREIPARARNVAQAQDRAPAGDASVGLDMAARIGPEQQVERPPDREQRIEPGLQVARRGWLQPLPETEQLLRIVGSPATVVSVLTAICTPLAVLQ